MLDQSGRGLSDEDSPLVLYKVTCAACGATDQRYSPESYRVQHQCPHAFDWLKAPARTSSPTSEENP